MNKHCWTEESVVIEKTLYDRTEGERKKSEYKKDWWKEFAFTGTSLTPKRKWYQPIWEPPSVVIMEDLYQWFKQRMIEEAGEDRRVLLKRHLTHPKSNAT